MRVSPLLAVPLLLALWAPCAATAQDQQAAAPTPGQPVFDMVAADRETAWRINRVTGAVTICRIDTTGGLDSVRARCAPATMAAGAEQAAAPEEGALGAGGPGAGPAPSPGEAPAGSPIR